MFKLEDFQGDYVMHCDTKEKADIFCAFLDSQHKKWNTGDSCLKDNHWNIYRQLTGYNFNNGSFANTHLYKAVDFTILEFDDFNWEMEYKVGDIVKCILKKEEDFQTNCVRDMKKLLDGKPRKVTSVTSFSSIKNTVLLKLEGIDDTWCYRKSDFVKVFDIDKVISTPENATIGKRYYYSDSIEQLQSYVIENHSRIGELINIDLWGRCIFKMKGAGFTWQYIYPCEEEISKFDESKVITDSKDAIIGKKYYFFDHLDKLNDLDDDDIYELLDIDDEEDTNYKFENDDDWNKYLYPCDDEDYTISDMDKFKKSPLYNLLEEKQLLGLSDLIVTEMKVSNENIIDSVPNLNCAFVWSFSSQGAYFWNTIYELINN